MRSGLTQADHATVEMKDDTKHKVMSHIMLAADLDIELERFRSLGESRFILGGLKSIIQHRMYQGEMSPREKTLSNGKEQGETREASSLE